MSRKNNMSSAEEMSMEERNTVAATVIPLFADGVPELSLDESKLSLTNLPIIASRDTVIFPSVTAPLSIGRPKSINVLDLVEK